MGKDAYYPMKKFTIAALIIGAFVLYSLMYNYSNIMAILPNKSTISSTSTSTSTNDGVPTPASNTDTPDTTTTPGNTGAANTVYKDGSYTGSVADAHWGNIQVKAIVKSGKITDVQFMQYPNDRNRSISINSDADPQLTTEAIQAQSANVDVVTGATDSSEAFIQSLTDALSQAKA